MALEVRWYIAPYEQVTIPGRSVVIRRVVVDQLTDTITADGGAWTEAECNGVRATGAGWAIVKVKAEPATHSLIAALPNVTAIPSQLTRNTSLGSLTNAQRNALRGVINNIGYDDAEINEHLPTNWSSITLGQLFDFLVANNALVAYSGGTFKFGRLQRKSIDQIDAELPG